jgi:nascent polypeptide-associated complex subunit alpha
MPEPEAKKQEAEKQESVMEKKEEKSKIDNGAPVVEDVKDDDDDYEDDDDDDDDDADADAQGKLTSCFKVKIIGISYT